MVMEFRVNGTMLMVMNILIVFLFMFVGSLDGQNKYPNILKPYNLHIQVYPCPNCEAWCANDPFFSCTYTCNNREAVASYRLDFSLDDDIEEQLSWEQESIDLRNKEDGQNKSNEIHIRIHERGIPELEKIITESCADKKTYKCTFEVFDYPVCTMDDYKPYDYAMEDCCQLMAKCVNDYDPKMCFEDGWYRFTLDELPYKNPKFWGVWNMGPHQYEYENMDQQHNVMKYCNMECTNGRLVRNNRSQTTETPKIKTTFSTKTSISTTKLTTTSTQTNIPTTKLTTSKISKLNFKNSNFKKLQNLSPTSNEVGDKNEAISHVIGGFLGINFVIVGAAIVAVIAELV